MPRVRRLTSRRRSDPEAVFQLPFDDVPVSMRAQAFGVPYIAVDEPNGGRLWVTRYGWRCIEHLKPGQWFYDQAYVARGSRLKGSTGSVYRVPTYRPSDTPGDHPPRRLDLVVKFSRVAQDVPLVISGDFRKDLGEDLFADLPDGLDFDAQFNSPFEEFGLVRALREPAPTLPGAGFRIGTKRPLAIYSPGQDLDLWRLGRHKGRFAVHQRRLREEHERRGGAAADEPQAPEPVKLDLRREYVMIYQWVKGRDAEQYCDQGLLTEDELRNLTRRVTREMRVKGFIVLDNKPRHYILRRRRDGNLLRRKGELVYNLIDFELLQRIEK